MARLVYGILLALAIGTFGLPLDDDERDGEIVYPADLGWLFDGNSHEAVTEMDLSQSVCNTTECRKIAHVLIESMDRSIDPCENFYEYACGNWAKNNPMPKDKDIWNLLYIVAERVGKQIEAILEEDSKPDDIIPLKLARKLFHSCMDLDAMNRRGLEPLVITLARGNGWPLIMLPEEWDEKETNWQKVDHYYAHLTGSFTFVRLWVDINENDTMYHVKLSPTYGGLGTYLLEDDEDEEDENSDSTEQGDSQEKGSKETEPKEDNASTTESPDEDDEGSNSVEDALRSVRRRHRREAERNVTKEERREAYKQFVSNVAIAIAKARGIPVTAEEIAEDVEDLTTFVANLTKILSMNMRSYRGRRRGREQSEDGNMTSIQDIQDWYDSLGLSSSTSKIKWLNTLNVVFEDADVEIDGDTMVSFDAKDHFERLGRLLEETSARTLVNFIHWNVITDMLEATTDEMRDLILDVRYFAREKPDISEEDKNNYRRQSCAYKVKATSIVGYEYVKRYFKEENLKLAKEMVKEIQDEVENQIMRSEWMDDATRDHALTKLKKLNALVGYPEWYKNKTIVDNYYKGTVVSPSYFENVLTYAKHYKLKRIKALTQPKSNETNDYGLDDPAEVNAYYTGDAIVITAADLQGPLFEAARPATVNFGIIGLIIAHEINHGFDANNFVQDSSGAEALTILADAFNERAGCFVEQYNNFSASTNLFNETIEDYGNQTAGENIADSMGLLAVFHALKNRERRNGRPEPSLPGLEDFTNEQMFFLSFANMWCETVDPVKGAKKFKRDSHSPGMLRVLGPLTNSEEFAEAYNCPVGSPMNPEKKCNIWK